MKIKINYYIWQREWIEYLEKINNEDFYIEICKEYLFIVKNKYEKKDRDNYYFEIKKEWKIDDYQNIYYLKYLKSKLDSFWQDEIKIEYLDLIINYLDKKVGNNNDK